MKALKIGDVDSAALLIKLGADVCLGDSFSECPARFIFSKNIAGLKKVIKEYFSAKRYKELENKYQQLKPGFVKQKALRLEEKSQNSFLDSIPEGISRKVSVLGENNLHKITPCISLRSDNFHKNDRTNCPSSVNKRTESEEVLTSNTNHDRPKTNFIENEIFPDFDLEMKPEIKSKMKSKGSLASYKQKISHLSEEIEKVNELIRATKAVYL